jgi:hypothetical protein
MWKKVMICAVVALILVPASVLAAGNMSVGGTEQGKQSAQAGNCTGDCTQEMHQYGTGNGNALGADGTQQVMYKYGSGNAQAGNCTGDCTQEMHQYGVNQDSSSTQKRQSASCQGSTPGARGGMSGRT